MVTSPCPMEMFRVSPPTHCLCFTFSFQSGVGRSPDDSPGRSIPVREPTPKSRAYARILSGPSLLPIVQKYTSQDSASPPNRSSYPWPVFFQQLKTLSPNSSFPVHSTAWVSGMVPPSTIAVVMTILNVDPGG